MVYGRWMALLDLCIKLLCKIKKQMAIEQAELLAVFAVKEDEDEILDDAD